ncbi:MAG: hypothetical protein M3Z96_05225 [Pseudomonadota bacterium]|nr:hypothetical protein [Pseudomonadota bacterium]
MKILELAARLFPGDLLETDGALHRIMVIERHKDFIWLGCAKHRDFWLRNNLEVWIDVPVNLASSKNWSMSLSKKSINFCGTCS